MMRLMIDTNIFLDVALQREGFWEASASVLSLGQITAARPNEGPHYRALDRTLDRAQQASTEKEYALYMPAHVVPTFLCICHDVGKKNNEESQAALADFLPLVTIGALDEATIYAGLALDFKDTEDAFVAAIAQRVGAQYVVTRNVKDFKHSPVPAIEPEALLGRLNFPRQSSEW